MGSLPFSLSAASTVIMLRAFTVLAFGFALGLGLAPLAAGMRATEARESETRVTWRVATGALISLTSSENNAAKRTYNNALAYPCVAT